MCMRPEDDERLRHMLDAAKEAITFTAGRARADLNTDRILALALVKEIESLVKKVSDGDLDLQLKRFVILQLENIRRAIIEYRIVGIKSLRLAYEATLGAVIVKPDILTAEKTSEVNRFARILKKVAALLESVGIKLITKAALEHLPKLLGS